jgi:hypothetical protein
MATSTFSTALTFPGTADDVARIHAAWEIGSLEQKCDIMKYSLMFERYGCIYIPDSPAFLSLGIVETDASETIGDYKHYIFCGLGHNEANGDGGYWQTLLRFDKCSSFAKNAIQRHVTPVLIARLLTARPN